MSQVRRGRRDATFRALRNLSPYLLVACLPPSVALSDDSKTSNVHSRWDGLYIGAGHTDFRFESASADDPARFYIASTPAHQAFEACHIPFAEARALHLGDATKANVRTIRQYVHPDICRSAQLLMGLTTLEPGSNWNTMPCHTHDRRMEVYFYFDLPESERVFHFMGEIDETRHLVVAPNQGVIAPSWSIHSGVGTASYSFIWSMAGENQVFEDMDGVPTMALR